jgi:type IX secretion system PorP/SprF family membrane protein
MFLKIKLTLIILIVDAGILLSQQLQFSNQYMVNRHFLSPAFSGITDNFETYITSQKNALRFPGGPEYKSIYTSGPVFENMSLGGSVSKSSVTIFNSFSAQLDYAYHLKVNERQYIHFGLSFEYIENYLGMDNQAASLQNDPFVLKYGHTFNTGFGLIYTYKTFQIGVAIPRMLESTFRNQETDNLVYSLSRIIRMHTSCFLNISQSFSLEPFIVIDKSNTEPLWYNISTSLRYKEITWLEIHYRQGGIMGIGLGGNLSKKILLNYSYDFSGAGIMKYSSGIHEVSLGFLIGKNSDRKYQKSAFRSVSKQPYYDWIK